MQTSRVDRYLREVAESLTGSTRDRARLLQELADHLDDAMTAKAAAGLEPAEAEAEAFAEIGSATSIADHWRARTERARRRQRTRLTLAAAVAAIAASVLGITSAASGHQNPSKARARLAGHVLSEQSPWSRGAGFGSAFGWSEGRTGAARSRGCPQVSPFPVLTEMLDLEDLCPRGA